MQNCVLVLFDTTARSVYWVWLIAVVVGFHRDTRRDAESTEPPLSRRPYTALTACAYVARASRGPSAKPRMLLLRCSGVDRTQKRLANKKNLTKSTWHSEIVNIVEFNGKWTRDSFFPITSWWIKLLITSGQRILTKDRIAGPIPKILPTPLWGSWPPPNVWFLAPTRVHNPNASWSLQPLLSTHRHIQTAEHR